MSEQGCKDKSSSSPKVIGLTFNHQFQIIPPEDDVASLKRKTEKTQNSSTTATTNKSLVNPANISSVLKITF